MDRERVDRTLELIDGALDGDSMDAMRWRPPELTTRRGKSRADPLARQMAAFLRMPAEQIAVAMDGDHATVAYRTPPPPPIPGRDWLHEFGVIPRPELDGAPPRGFTFDQDMRGLRTAYVLTDEVAFWHVARQEPLHAEDLMAAMVDLAATVTRRPYVVESWQLSPSARAAGEWMAARLALERVTPPAQVEAVWAQAVALARDTWRTITEAVHELITQAAAAIRQAVAAAEAAGMIEAAPPDPIARARAARANHGPARRQRAPKRIEPRGHRPT